MTAAVTARGFLSDDYRVRAQDVEWVQGGQDQVLPESLTGRPPAVPHVHIESAPPGRTLSEMLVSGAIDALISPWTGA